MREEHNCVDSIWSRLNRKGVKRQTKKNMHLPKKEEQLFFSSIKFLKYWLPQLKLNEKVRKI